MKNYTMKNNDMNHVQFYKINLKKISKCVAAATLGITVFMSVTMFEPGSAHAASYEPNMTGGTAAESVVQVQSAAASAEDIIGYGQQFMGTPYLLGSKPGQTATFDCSSFAQHVFKQFGIDLPRSSRQQSKVGRAVSRDELQPGDLVFFYSPIHHVAIYMGNGKILHTYGAPGVTVSDLNSGNWDKHYASARRVL